MKSFAFACTLAVLAACADEPAPVPRPDPALVERLALANRAAPAPRLAKADKIVAAVGRTDPDRLADPAERLLAR